jgi:hypothetical protein
MKQPLEGSWRAINRHCQLLAHDCYRKVDLGDAAQHVGDEVASVECGRVAMVGDFVIGGAVNVVENGAGQALFGQSAEVMKIKAMFQTHDA